MSAYSKIAFNLKREIQLWLSNLVKIVTDFAQCQREFFVIKNMPFSDFYVTRLPLNRGLTVLSETKRNETKRNGTLRNGTLRNGTLRNGTLRNGTLRNSTTQCFITPYLEYLEFH